MPEPTTTEPSKLASGQVDSLFKSMFKGELVEPEKPEEKKPEAALEPQAAAATPAEPSATDTEPAKQETTVETVETKEPEAEDIESLKKRLSEREKYFEEQLAKARKQGSSGIDWAKNLALRKANESAQAKDLLRRIAAGEQVPKEDVEKILIGTVDVSPLVAQPTGSQGLITPDVNPFAPAPLPQQADDFSVADTQQFMLDYGLDEDSAQKFVSWMQDPKAPLTARDVVPGSLYHTLASAYRKYEAVNKKESDVKARAVASLARTQRETVKAAGTLAGRASPSPPADEPVDWTKLKTEERLRTIDIGKLFQQLQDNK